MSKYIKPTISLLNVGTSTASASSCSTSTADANQVLDILASMGFDPETAFGMNEACANTVFLDYCKFTSSIQVFFS